MKECCNEMSAPKPGRRQWIKAAGAAAAVAAGAGVLPGQANAVSLSKEQRDAMTPDQVLEMLREGNARFRGGTMNSHDFLAQKRATVTGQYPAAVILSCIDSRAPAEIIFDAGIGDVFGARVAGNVLTPDLLGSIEFSCAIAGAKLVLVMGHTACGAIAGAINGVQLGNLTGLLDRIRPVVDAAAYVGDRSGSNPDFVNAVAVANVNHTITRIRRESPLLAGLEQQGKIRIAGAMYGLGNGQVDFLN
ncbi:MAG: carbonic anhydrase family protein [Burkholderiaceae bacterium]